ncbi:hypothetical protein CEXT_743871 [Caerostris extrusa]|uniref:Uncharacterized protein n=1 Tax=Caerostris extrusa TaxID=172846 RepID=A0AAV4NCE8_CAEEX|nr:hypothetical protein CEXT_743871 [Caerostris extrusa]
MMTFSRLPGALLCLGRGIVERDDEGWAAWCSSLSGKRNCGKEMMRVGLPGALVCLGRGIVERDDDGWVCQLLL